MSEAVRSKQLVSIVEVISEGEIAGLVDGHRSIYLDNTPIENITRGKNFEKVEVDQRLGQARQSVMSRFGQTEKEISVGTELKHGIPLTRTITDPKVNRVRLTLGVTSLFKQEDDGGDSAQSVDFKITIGQRIEYLTISGKHHSQYLRNIMLGHLPAVPFTIKVERVQPDSDSLRLQNKTLWSAYTEIIDTAFAYPHTALVGIKFDSQYFSNIPTRTYDVLGIKVNVPSNYDPVRRTYTGLWDGTFKLAWTNNPAWILYDLVTSKRYGLGQRLGEFGADKWALYQVAQYCDQLIPDGFGGKEPRFTCNVWLTEQRSAYEVINDICSIFRAMPVWNGTELTVIMDRPADPVWTYTAANVIGGFSRQYSAMKARHNAIQVEYLDAENNYEKAIEYVSDDEAIRKYGLNLKKVTAFGCTSRGQAHRTGLWILMTEKLETESISFNVGAEGLMHIPGDIIRVADTQYAGANIGGRVLAVNGRTLTLDREITLSGNSYFQYINGEAKPVNIKISHANGNTVTLDRAPAGLSVNGVWSLTTQQISSQLYRAMTISENEDGSYTIMALQHEPQKEAIVDNGAVFEPRNTTLHRTPRLEHLDVQLDAGSVKFAWQTTSGIGTLTYDVRILKDGKLYAYHKGLTGLELALDDLPDGEYEVVIIAKNAQGQVVSEKTQTFVINRPPVPEDVMVSGGLTDVTLSWKWWDDATQTEIWASETDDIRTAKRVAKVLASTYTHNVGPNQIRYYWLRHTRGQNKGLFYQEQGLKAETAVDIDEELRVLNEKLSENIVDKVFDVAAPARGLEMVKTVDNLPTEFIGHNTIYVLADGKQYNWNGEAYVGLVKATDVIPTSQLEDSLVQQLNQNTQAIGQESRERQTALATEARHRTQALQAEATNRTRAIQAETTNRTKAIQAESNKLTKAVQDEARTRGTAITRLENVDRQQAQQITQVTTKAEQALTGLSAERQARIQGDQAEANAREVLTTRVSAAESGITTLQRSVANQTTALSEVSQTLTAKLDNLQVGGRNYLQWSRDFEGWTFSKHPNETLASEKVNGELVLNGAVDYWWKQFGLVGKSGSKAATTSSSEALSHLEGGQTYTLSFEAKAEEGEPHLKFEVREYRKNTYSVTPAHHRFTLTNEWRKYQYTFTLTHSDLGSAAFDAWGVEFTYRKIGKIRLRKPKLEQGTIATDWSPAPEDTDSDIAKVSANLTAYQQTQATKESAQAETLRTLNTRLGTAEGTLTNLANTRATKTEVATLARNALQSEWQTKATEAQNAAIAEAQRLNTATSAKIDQVQQTLSNAQGATAQEVRTLTASVNNLSVGGRNFLRNSRFENDLTHWKNWGDCTRRIETLHNKKWLRLTTDNRAPYRGIAQTVIAFERRTRYTLSFKAYSLRENAKLQLAVHQIPNNNPQVWSSPIAITATPQTYSWSFTSADLDNKTGFHLMLGGLGRQPFDVYLTEIKFEKGTVATDWSPAPEDTDTALTGIRADITAASRTVADLNDKVQSTHTIKAQAIAGGRTAIAGIALGATADNRTAESSVIVMADRFGVVKNAQDGTVKPMFNVVNNKVAIHGDLVADGSITATKLAANSVTTGALQAGAIRTEHLAAGQVSADKLAIGLGGNLLTNPIFANDAYGWSSFANNGATLVGRSFSQDRGSWGNPAYLPNENRLCLRFNTNGRQHNERIGGMICYSVPVLPNHTYVASVFLGAHRCKAGIGIDLRGANDSYESIIWLRGDNESRAGFDNGMAGAKRAFVVFRTQATTQRLDFLIAAYATTNTSNATLFAMRPMLEECTEHTREPSPWQNAGVTSIHGGSIATNSITAQQIAANTITGNEIVAGTVATKHLAARSVTSDRIMAGVELSAPTMRGGTVYAGHFDGGSININNRFKVNNQGQVEMRSAANNVGMVINNEQIIVYDQHGRVRVKMGRLNDKN